MMYMDLWADNLQMTMMIIHEVCMDDEIAIDRCDDVVVQSDVLVFLLLFLVLWALGADVARFTAGIALVASPFSGRGRH